MVDIGSSGYGQKGFRKLFSVSRIIGFDPDSRGQDAEFSKGFNESTLVPKAITHQEDADSVQFFLTQQPSCSSTLQPNFKILNDYIFKDKFRVIKTFTTPATTISKVIDSFGLNQIDWIKIDSQGSDLNILKSIRKNDLSKISVIDIEPGMLQFYEGENTFYMIDKWLLENDFWLSDLTLQKYSRITLESYGEILDQTQLKSIDNYLKKNPTAAEARYFRTNQYLRQNADKRQLVVSSVSALVNGDIGYAYDISKIYIEKFGMIDVITKIQNYIVEQIKVQQQFESSSLMGSKGIKSKVKNYGRHSDIGSPNIPYNVKTPPRT